MKTADESPRNAVERIAHQIEELIVTGTFGPGTHINEHRLALRLGVSRASVREACRRLEQAGLIDIVPNHGAHVRALSLNEIVQVFDIRASLGRLAGQQGAASMKPSNMATLRQLMIAMEAAMQAHDADRYVQLNLQFHACIYEGTGNARLAALDRALGKELRIYRRHGLAFGGGLAVSNQEHQVIVSAIERGDREEAGLQLERHIQNGRDRFLRAMTATGQLILKPDESDALKMVGAQ